MRGRMVNEPRNPQKHKNLQYLKEHFKSFSSKNTKNRQDVHSPEPGRDVVQHRLIAGRCTPLRVLFISKRYFFNILNLVSLSSNNNLIIYSPSIRVDAFSLSVFRLVYCFFEITLPFMSIISNSILL